jgi:hypothetical protein
LNNNTNPVNLNLNNNNRISDALTRKGNNNESSSSNYNDYKDYSNVNNNLVNLNKFITDIHDNAYFTNLNKLNHLKEFPTYSKYQYLFKNDNKSRSSISISNLACNFSSNSSHNDTNLILLNNWFDMIHIDLVKLTNSHNSSTSKLSFCSSHQSTSIVCKANCLTNIIDQTNLFDLSFIHFFLKVLNGNFYKLKHLVDYLNDLILTTNSNDTLIANELILINEIITFLKLPCTFTLFQLALRTKFYS